jgi:hypothetical protein
MFAIGHFAEFTYLRIRIVQEHLQSLNLEALGTERSCDMATASKHPRSQNHKF